MPAKIVPVKNPEASPVELAGGLRYVARQPILDLRRRVHGYELLFRAGPEAAFRGDGDHATRTMLDNTVIFGLDKMTCGLPAFVNCTVESLTEKLVQVLPPSMTVLEILETLEPTPALIEACRNLKSIGYRFALDDFIWKPELVPLVELADYIKIDFAATTVEQRKEQLRLLSGVPVALIAEKVETEEEQQQACDEGFTLFQGFFFYRPVLLMGRKVPPNRLIHLQMLEVLRESPLNLRHLTELVKRDASLTFRLLKLVNSPVCAVRQEVRSIKTALMMVGEESFRRIATLAIASELNAGQPAEILRMAFVRARFCELAAGLCALDPTEQYLLGLFSLLPAMLRVPMTELAPALPLREAIREALMGADSEERTLLQWVEGLEQGDWDQSDSVVQANGLNPEDVMRCYGAAVVWTETALSYAE
jgi:EAL and modified HD-GYP domain-containing signal transduction protein